MIDTQGLVVVGFVYGEDKLIASLRPHQKSSFSRNSIFLNIGKENSENKQELICFKKLWDTPALLLSQCEASEDAIFFPHNRLPCSVRLECILRTSDVVY